MRGLKLAHVGFFERSAWLGAMLCAFEVTALGQFVRPPTLSSPLLLTASCAEPAPIWANLTATQRASLHPLARDWAGLDGRSKQEWIKLAERFPHMSAQDRARMRSRMSEWTRLTPRQRGQARLRFQAAKRATAQDRRASWEAYQALPAHARHRLAVRAKRADAATRKVRSRALLRGAQRRINAPAVPNAVQAKSNIVPNTSLASPPQPVAPSVVQAQPGATTTLMSKQPSPPAHQQTGLPKIAATPGFVDKATLLPQRGAQGAGVHRSLRRQRQPHRDKQR